MVVTDLDGTLLRDDKSVSPFTLEVFRRLGRQGVIRVAATGRSLHAARKVLPADLPFDYLIFSTGMGMLEVASGAIRCAAGFTASQSAEIVAHLDGHHLDFTLHHPAPDNHRFLYRRRNVANHAFSSYLNFYDGFSQPLAQPALDNACQFLSIMPPDLARFEAVAAGLASYKVVRTSSPSDNESLWMEVFPRGAGKGPRLSDLARELGVPPSQILAFGNDFNDIDFLDFAGHSFVVSNASPELRGRYPVVGANGADGVARAVVSWIPVLCDC